MLAMEDYLAMSNSPGPRSPHSDVQSVASSHDQQTGQCSPVSSAIMVENPLSFFSRSSSTQGALEEVTGIMRIPSPTPSPSPLTWGSTSRGRSPDVKLGISPPPEQGSLSPPTLKSLSPSFSRSASRSTSPHSHIQIGIWTPSHSRRSFSLAQRENFVGYGSPIPNLPPVVSQTPVRVQIGSPKPVKPVFTWSTCVSSSPVRNRNIRFSSSSRSPSRGRRPYSRSRSPLYPFPRSRTYSRYCARSRSRSNPPSKRRRSPSPNRCRYPPPSPSRTNIETHREYNFDDASVSFIVEDRMRFNVHRYLFLRESRFFRGLLSARPNRYRDSYVIPELKIEEFETLLRFFYEGMYQLSPITTPMKFWINLLSITTRLDFPKAREYAIAAIDLLQSSGDSDSVGPAEMIQIATMNEVEKWLQPAYSALSEREELLSDLEAEIIGAKGVLLIAKAREARLKEMIRSMAPHGIDQNRSPHIISTTSRVPFGPVANPSLGRPSVMKNFEDAIQLHSQETAQCGLESAALAFGSCNSMGHTTSVAQSRESELPISISPVILSSVVTSHTIPSAPPLPYANLIYPEIPALPTTSTNPVAVRARSPFSIGHLDRNSSSSGLLMRPVNASKSSSSPAVSVRSVAETVVDEIFFKRKT